jgi:zinc protease
MRALIMACSILACLAASPLGASPVIEHWTTSQGARVYFVQAQQIPIVDIRVVFDAGSARDGATPGLALLTNDVMAEGAGGMSADEFSAAMETTGANFGTGALRDMAWVSLRSMADRAYLDPALRLFATALSLPTFADAAVARERNRVLAAIRSREESPEEVAEEAFFAAVFRNHPYATPVLGQAESVAKLDASALKRFHRGHYVARNAVIAIVGALDRNEARRTAEDLVQGLPAGARAQPLDPAPELARAEDITLLHPSEQSHVWVGQPGVSRSDPDYFPLLVGNHVLGGNGFASILMDEIREKRGLSYGVASQFSPLAGRGPFIASLQTGNAQVGEARAKLKELLRDFVADGPTEPALQEAKRNLIGGFPLRISSNGRIVEYVAMIGFYGLPLDYLDTYTDKIDAVASADVKAAFKRRLNPERMVTVTVGGAANGAAPQN